MQNVLLAHLGVSPWAVDSNTPWPLQVYPRTLAVLSQVRFYKTKIIIQIEQVHTNK